MDAVASGPKDGNTPDGAVYINPESKEDVELTATLVRAAAKVVVTLKESSTSEYKFLQDETRNFEKGYYIRNMPYKTKVITQAGDGAYPPLVDNVDYLRTPDKANDSAFEWINQDGQEKKVVVTAYVYSHEWNNEGDNTHYARGTSLVVNIPMWKDNNRDGQVNEGDDVYENSFFQIAIVAAKEDVWKIERNTIYELEGTVLAPGAEDNKKPLVLDIKYKTHEWIASYIPVTGDDAHYLEVNKPVLEMRNVEEDASLTFTSSSPVTVTLSGKPYYYNKYGERIEIDDATLVSTPEWTQDALTGTIVVESKKPENLTPRYFTLKVSNGHVTDDKYVKVIQYPVICVSNQLGWYSYREDFNFNYESSNQSNARVSVGVNVDANGLKVNSDGEIDKYYGTVDYSSYSYKVGSWFNQQTITVTYFFNSKVRGDAENNKHVIHFYDENRENKQDNICETHNARMYQMQVMATSEDYVVGKPRLDAKGYTDRSEENNRLVSPSFMIASRLGSMLTGYGNLNNLENGGNGGWRYNETTKGFEVVMESGDNSFTTANAAYDINKDQLLKVYEDHCKNYVEVVGTPGNTKIYKDWRLPTRAELLFIIDNQGADGENADAIDYLLNGGFYYSAIGPVYNTKRNSDGKAVRCVHDVFVENLVISKQE